MNSFYTIIDTLTQFLYTGFGLALPLLLVLYFVWKSQRRLWMHLIVTNNILLLFAATLGGLKYIIDLLVYMQSAKHSDPFLWRVTGPYWYTYWIMLIAQLLLPHLFWWERNRWRISISLLMLVDTAIVFIMQIIILFGSYRDYLPYSWAYYAPDFFAILIGIVSYAVVLGGVSFVLEKWTGLLVRNASSKSLKH